MFLIHFVFNLYYTYCTEEKCYADGLSLPFVFSINSARSCGIHPETLKMSLKQQGAAHRSPIWFIFARLLAELRLPFKNSKVNPTWVYARNLAELPSRIISGSMSCFSKRSVRTTVISNSFPLGEIIGPIKRKHVEIILRHGGISWFQY